MPACRRESKFHRPGLLFLPALSSSARSESGKTGALWGSPREASGSGVPGACQEDVPVQNERPVTGRGGSLYLSCRCLMYTNPLYLLSNKRNTSVLPTETAQALTAGSPRARRRSRALRLAETHIVGTSAPRQVPAHRSMGVCGWGAGRLHCFVAGEREGRNGAFLLDCFQAQCFPWDSAQLALVWGHQKKTATQGHLKQSVPDFVC